MLPDMSDVLTEWEIPVLLKTVQQITVDLRPADVVTVEPILAVCQPAQKERINPDIIDWSKAYIQVHTKRELFTNQVIEFNGEDYRITEDGNYALYGYSEVIAEQTKKPLLIETTP